MRGKRKQERKKKTGEESEMIEEYKIGEEYKVVEIKIKKGDMKHVSLKDPT